MAHGKATETGHMHASSLGIQVPTVSEALPSLLPEHHMSIQRGKRSRQLCSLCCRVFDDGEWGGRNMVFLISVLILFNIITVTYFHP